MAPTVATIRSAISPLALNPRNQNRMPPTNEPATPMIRSLTRPKLSLGDLSGEPAGGQADEEEVDEVHESHGFVLLRREVVKQRESAGT